MWRVARHILKNFIRLLISHISSAGFSFSQRKEIVNSCIFSSKYFGLYFPMACNSCPLLISLRLYWCTTQWWNRSCFIFIQCYAKFKFKKVTMVSPAQSEMKNNLKTNYKPKMLFQFFSLKSSTVESGSFPQWKYVNQLPSYVDWCKLFWWEQCKSPTVYKTICQ